MIQFPALLTCSFTTVALLGLTSCSLQKITTSAEPTGFISSSGVDRSSKIRRVSFDHSWRVPTVALRDYKPIMITPVTTSHLRMEQWRKSYSGFVPNQKAYIKQCESLARTLTSSLESEFSKKSSIFNLTDSRSNPDTLIFEVALTEVTFGRPEGYVGAMTLPGGTLVNSAAASPIVAFEARDRDATSGNIIATADDRSGVHLKLIDLNS
jgi:hypothetical protein